MATQAATNTLEAFRNLVHETHDVGAVQGLLGWDLEVFMPPRGAEMRSHQMATLAKLSHQMRTSPELGRYLEELRQERTYQGLSRIDRALVDEVGREYDKARKLPVELVQEISRTTSEANGIWAEARKQQDFGKFAPMLGKIIELNRRFADAMGYEDSPYNALLDEYERDLTVKQLDPLFADLKQEVVPLLKAITDASPPERGFLKQVFPIEPQLAFSRQVLEDMGFDFEAGRLDLSVHPFSSGSSTDDVRLTTRVFNDDVFSALSSSMHEGGHGMYEQGVSRELNRTPLAEGTSLGIHESQSRMWENQVGRGNAFWTHYFPQLQQTFAPQLDQVTTEQFYRAVNVVQPSFIRVEADEVTYNLHIVLRYEIERDLIEGRLAVREIPEAWNAKVQEYLGITPPNDALGCLQDIHWAHGSFGYFPTYTLGNLYAAQFFRQARQEVPDLDGKIARGELKALKGWLNEQIHAVGKMETADQIARRVTGESLNARYFVDYLKAKYGEVYGLT